MNDDLVRLVALCQVSGLGGARLRGLLDVFDGLADILAAAEPELRAVSGIGPRIAAAIRALDLEQTTRDVAAWQEAGLAIIPWDDARYPARLLALPDAPPVLFSWGCTASIQAADAQTVGIVGTRRPSQEAARLAWQLGYGLARRKWTVISGLAWGVDFAAHNGAAHAGQTVAVLGSGLFAPLAGRKQTLAERMVDHDGALVSEVMPPTPPAPNTLVARNRLIAGLSRAVIVVEAATGSGSLHTARFANRQGRAVYAIDNGSTGNAELLADGARVLATDDTTWDALADDLSRLP